MVMEVLTLALLQVLAQRILLGLKMVEFMLSQILEVGESMEKSGIKVEHK